MKEHYADHTPDIAIGNVDREWRYMAQLAVRLRERGGPPLWMNEQEAKFTGIFKRLLTDPIDEVKREAERNPNVRWD